MILTDHSAVGGFRGAHRGLHRGTGCLHGEGSEVVCAVVVWYLLLLGPPPAVSWCTFTLEGHLWCIQVYEGPLTKGSRAGQT